MSRASQKCRLGLLSGVSQTERAPVRLTETSVPRAVKATHADSWWPLGNRVHLGVSPAWRGGGEWGACSARSGLDYLALAVPASGEETLCT